MPKGKGYGKKSTRATGRARALGNPGASKRSAKATEQLKKTKTKGTKRKGR